MGREVGRVPSIPGNIVPALWVTARGLQPASRQCESQSGAAPRARWERLEHQLRAESQSGLFSWLVPSTKKVSITGT